MFDQDIGAHTKAEQEIQVAQALAERQQLVEYHWYSEVLEFIGKHRVFGTAG